MNLPIKTIIAFLFFAFVVTSCQREIHIPYRMNKVLELAGNNKNELLKVLKHYQAPEDSLKLQAAYFLIENLEGKTFYSGSAYHQVCKAIDSCAADTATSVESLKLYGIKLDKVLSSYNDAVFEFSEDIQHLSSDYLIRSIDDAFESVEFSWVKNKISFQYFSQYILPYKVGEEPMEDWRRAVWRDYHDVLDTLKAKNPDVLTAAKIINAAVARRFKPRGLSTYSMSFGYSDLCKVKYGSCYDGVVYTIFVMRALGVPVSLEFTPVWGNRNGGHQWVAVHLPNGKNIPFDPTYDFRSYYERFKQQINRTKIPSNYAVVGKIYRRTYEQNKTTDEVVPSFFKQNMVDVTAEYTSTSNVKIPISRNSLSSTYACLYEFDANGWRPVQLSRIVDDHQVIFNNVGTGVVFLPACMNDEAVIPIDDPFVVEKTGHLRRFKAQQNNMIVAHLTRKYTYFQRMISYADRMRGGMFQAANTKDFSDAAVLYCIRHRPEPYYQEVPVQNKHAYRYVRYVSPDSCGGDVAEIEFYTKAGKEPLDGTVIGVRGEDESSDIIKAFDKDKLTFYTTMQMKGIWIGMDFGKPVTIQKIRYLPRNDGNTIEPGDEYELLYWNDKWISLGAKKAAQYSLQYSVPANALLWLKDLTRGKEERIFTWEHGKQVWW
jgi:hypothetical protein